jgi:hypothetical protein
VENHTSDFPHRGRKTPFSFPRTEIRLVTDTRGGDEQQPRRNLRFGELIRSSSRFWDSSIEPAGYLHSARRALECRKPKGRFAGSQPLGKK